MDIPRLGVELELPLWPTPQPQQHWILNPLMEAKDPTRVSWILVRFITAEPHGNSRFYHHFWLVSPKGLYPSRVLCEEDTPTRKLGPGAAGWLGQWPKWEGFCSCSEELEWLPSWEECLSFCFLLCISYGFWNFLGVLLIISLPGLPITWKAPPYTQGTFLSWVWEVFFFFVGGRAV